jgi:hypothetical protein
VHAQAQWRRGREGQNLEVAVDDVDFGGREKVESSEHLLGELADEI